MSEPTFKYIEYTGPDAGEVLINMLANITKLELDAGNDKPQVHDLSDKQDTRHVDEERVVGFQRNPEEDDDE